MKKLLINSFFIPALSFCHFNTVMCQHAMTAAQYPSDIVTTIIKEYNYPATVSYVETIDKHYFAFADASMSIINCEIDPQIFVNDFVIHDEMVYFCGIDNSNGTNGVWGWFKIQDLIAGNLVYETYSKFECNSFQVDSLHKIVAYNDNGKHITPQPKIRLL